MLDPINVETLKIVSRVKHKILASYLEPWGKILGSRHKQLAYVDCYAGAGIYKNEKGTLLDGSPIVALKAAAVYLQGHPGAERHLYFVEQRADVVEKLKTVLLVEESNGLPSSLKYHVFQADAQDFMDDLVSENAGKPVMPTFFFIDPYGHPISLPTIRQILALGQTEVFVNVMWYQISRDISNPKMRAHVDRLFGHSSWQSESFVSLSSAAREKAFFKYLIDEIGARYSLVFPVRFSPEDRTPGGEHRTKFALVHLSSHPKAASLMKDVMWSLSDDSIMLEYSGRDRLFFEEPDLDQLRDDLLRNYQGQRVEFDQLRLLTLDWPFAETHYRKVLKELEKSSRLSIIRIDSKKTGLKKRDLVVFP